MDFSFFSMITRIFCSLSFVCTRVSGKINFLLLTFTSWLKSLHSFLWNMHFFLIPDQTRNPTKSVSRLLWQQTTEMGNVLTLRRGKKEKKKKKEVEFELWTFKTFRWYQNLVLLLLVQKCLNMVQPNALLKADTACVRNRWEFTYKLCKLSVDFAMGEKHATVVVDTQKVCPVHRFKNVS